MKTTILWQSKVFYLKLLNLSMQECKWRCRNTSNEWCFRFFVFLIFFCFSYNVATLTDMSLEDKRVSNSNSKRRLARTWNNNNKRRFSYFNKWTKSLFSQHLLSVNNVKPKQRLWLIYVSKTFFSDRPTSRMFKSQELFILAKPILYYWIKKSSLSQLQMWYQ